MTAPMRNGEHRSEFGKWIRACAELDSKNGFSLLDVDWCWHQYKTTKQGRNLQNMMFIEEKTFNSDCGVGQKDTLRQVAQVLMGECRSGQPKLYKVKNSFGDIVTLRYWGYHLLRFSHAGPMQSLPSNDGWIEWDRKRISLRNLMDIMHFKLSPITLRLRDERNHHGGARQMMLLPQHAGVLSA